MTPVNSAQPLLSVRDLSTYFELDEGTVKAVDGVSFDVYPAQVVGIVGESGCGKSVTVKSILGLVEPPGRVAAGRILFRYGDDGQGAGQTSNDASAGYRDLARLNRRGKQMRAVRGGEIALIPQEPMAAFSPVHTIGNQIVEAARLHRSISKADATALAIDRLSEVGVPSPERCMESYSWELSGGLRQRAMIGMALAANPRLLIADEPTTALDVTTQAQVLGLLRELQRQHDTAFIFITHDLGVIAQLADVVVVMYLGKVAESGPVDRIFHHPRHPYTRALLESIPSLRAEGRSPLPTIQGSIPHPFHRPAGCAFGPRCQDFMPAVCDQTEPALIPVEASHMVGCLKYRPAGTSV